MDGHDVIEFRHVISESEHRSTYLILRDETGRSYGDKFPGPHKARLALVGHAANNWC